MQIVRLAQIKTSLKRWLALLVSLLAVWLFVFVVAPAGRKIPCVRLMMSHIDESGIEASALYYTGVEETATSEMYLHNARIYRPRSHELR